MNENLIPIGWDDIKDEFRKLNHELADVIDDLNPSKDFRLYRVKYCFGSDYLRYGKLFLPGHDKELIALTSHKVPKQIQEDLAYNLGSNPVSFILDKTIELYMPHRHRPTPVPFMQIPPGHLFSTSGVLRSNIQRHQAPFLWNMSAGARSIFMLPKISKTKNYRHLRRSYGHRIQPPNSMSEHWSLFKNLYDYDLLGEWHLEVIFFSKSWFEHLDKPKFSKLKQYMQKDLYEKLSYWSTQQFWNNYFSMLNNISGTKPDSYVYDTVRHLLLLSMGALPGIAPSTNENSAPVAAIQKLFKEDYKLEKYLPIVMELTSFNPYKKSNPVYYSLNYANAHELSARSNDHTSTIMELYEIKCLLQHYLRKMQDNEINISHTVLSEIPRLVDFTFFHNAPQNYKDIHHSQEIFKNNNHFTKTIDQKNNFNSKNQEHPCSSPFTSGCIQIKNKGE